MNEQEKIQEVKKLLLFIYFEWNKEITEELVRYWLTALRGIDRRDAWKAAKKLSERKTFGEPKFQDFADCIREIQESKPKKYNPWSAPKPVKEIIREISPYEKKLLE